MHFLKSARYSFPIAVLILVINAQAQTYHLTDLGTGAAYGINSSGQVTGGSSSNHHAFLWTPTTPNGVTGTMVDIGDLFNGSGLGTGRRINDFGQVVGQSRSSATSADYKAFVWTPTTPNAAMGSIIDISASLPPSSHSIGQDINATGQAVIWSQSYGGYLWSPSSQNGTIGSTTALNVRFVSGINASGQVSGLDGSLAQLWTPFVNNGTTGSSVPLGDLTGINQNWAYDINESGQITGWVQDYNGPNGVEWRGYLWTPDTPNGTTGTFKFLGGLGTGDNTLPAGMNDLGAVVGYANGLAFVWDATAGIQDLNSLLDSTGTDWTLTNAQEINDAGQIVGYGMYDPDGPGGVAPVTHAFLLTPLPEPTLMLAPTGIFAFLSRRRVRAFNAS